MFKKIVVIVVVAAVAVAGVVASSGPSSAADKVVCDFQVTNGESVHDGTVVSIVSSRGAWILANVEDEPFEVNDVKVERDVGEVLKWQVSSAGPSSISASEVSCVNEVVVTATTTPTTTTAVSSTTVAPTTTTSVVESTVASTVTVEAPPTTMGGEAAPAVAVPAEPAYNG